MAAARGLNQVTQPAPLDEQALKVALLRFKQGFLDAEGGSFPEARQGEWVQGGRTACEWEYVYCSGNGEVRLEFLDVETLRGMHPLTDLIFDLPILTCMRVTLQG